MDANCCEKTNHNRARTYCIYALRSVASILHGIKKGLRVTKPLNVLDEVKATQPPAKSYWIATPREGGNPGWGSTGGPAATANPPSEPQQKKIL